MTKRVSPVRWAIDVSRVLNAALGVDRFPVDVSEVAREYSRHRFPEDPVTFVAGDSLPGFEGALFRAPAGKKGWGIIYNTEISSRGRINFTLAHEFGHYLLHRLVYPDGLRCGQQNVVRWESELGQVEYEANVFAANLLMPLDDYRRQVDPETQVSLDQLSGCATHYDVSLIAATLRWLEFTKQRAVLVVSRDGYILWAKSSKRALKSGLFFRTSGPPIAIPNRSVAATREGIASERYGIELPPGVWFNEPCREIPVFSDHYDFTISVLQFEAEPIYSGGVNDDDTDESLGDKIRRNHALQT